MTINAGPRFGKFSSPLTTARIVKNVTSFASPRIKTRKIRRFRVRRGNSTRSGRHTSVTGLGGRGWLILHRRRDILQAEGQPDEPSPGLHFVGAPHVSLSLWNGCQVEQWVCQCAFRALVFCRAWHVARNLLSFRPGPLATRAHWFVQ